MKVACLISGGKDSLYAAYLAEKQGHSISWFATIHSKNKDSYMYHTLNMGIPIIQAELAGKKLVSKESSGEKEKELHDLEILLNGLSVEGVVCGAIASKYQRSRLEKICKKLNLKLIAPLWGVSPDEYMADLIKAGFKAVIVGVFADGFDKSWLGREIDETCLADLKKLEKSHKIHLAGEGGEFETTVLDCPMFSKRIIIKDSEIHWDEKSKTGNFEIKDVHFEEK